MAGDAWWRAMQRGEFARAWRICDNVLQQRRGQRCDHLPRHLQWLWDGSSVQGERVTVHCFHGLGDTIQFIRLARPLRYLASFVRVRAQAELLPLLQGVEGVDALEPLDAPDSEACSDAVQVELMELPHVLRLSTRSIPASVPYLHTGCEPARASRNGGDARLRVGLVWAAGDWDLRRSIPLGALEPWWELRGVDWHVLQRGEAVKEWNGPGVIAGSDDPLQAARVMQGLDLVLTVDSMPAHLAGALGVPTWTLLQHACDWRWMLGRADSPWYPTMRLFRQPRPGNWTQVIRSVKRLLEKPEVFFPA